MTMTMLSADALRSLGADLPPSDVMLLRLRLRFGSPQCVALGDAFRVCVDVVDEMARPPTGALADALLGAGFCPQLALYGVCEDGRLAMSSRSLGMPSVGPGGALVARFDCVVSSAVVSTGVFRLKVCVDGALLRAPTLSTSHMALQAFCAGSEWFLDPSGRSQTLVLPVISDEIHLAESPVSSSSSRCLRVFSLPGRVAPLHIQEDYGLAMGSHVWDASIWLSLALVLSPWTRNQPQTVELGAGCGLFAVVYAKLGATASSRMLLTDRGDALASLAENLHRNDVESSDGSVCVSELVWGDRSCVLPYTPDVVFAADVLYHWSAHEALLATLLDLVPAHSTCPVIIAHKHRGDANAKRLAAVFALGFDTQCDKHPVEGCAWAQWRVQRLVRVANIEFLKLTRHQKPIDSMEGIDSV